MRTADFVLKKNFFEFNGEVKRQKSGTAIRTKSASPYACIFLVEVETEFLKSQEFQHFYIFQHFRYIFYVDSWRKKADSVS